MSCRVVGIDHAGKALEKLAETEVSEFPDIIFLDINMPQVDGWLFLEKFREITSSIEKTIKIFMVSSSTDRSDKDKAKTYPEIEDYIVKPFNLDLLNKCITE